MGENHRIILGDVCGLARVRNVRRRPVLSENSIRPILAVVDYLNQSMR